MKKEVYDVVQGGVGEALLLRRRSLAFLISEGIYNFERGGESKV